MNSIIITLYFSLNIVENNSVDLWLQCQYFTEEISPAESKRGKKRERKIEGEKKGWKKEVEKWKELKDKDKLKKKKEKIYRYLKCAQIEKK